MSFKRTELSSSVLDGVLVDYKKISQAPDDPSDTRLYKALDQRSGEVYLVTNPAAWARRADADGRTTLIRPMPVGKGHIGSLPKETQQERPALPPADVWGGF
jgi:hypothetical protein